MADHDKRILGRLMTRDGRVVQLVEESLKNGTKNYYVQVRQTIGKVHKRAVGAYNDKEWALEIFQYYSSLPASSDTRPGALTPVKSV